MGYLLCTDGRPRYVNVLDCYLKKNLVSNGGYLDEVVFMVNTKYEEDQKWLDELIATEPLYQKKITTSLGGHFDNIWNRHAQDENTLYIKIDDDIVRCPKYHHEVRRLLSIRCTSMMMRFPEWSIRSWTILKLMTLPRIL